jgi:hypothetical protein
MSEPKRFFLPWRVINSIGRILNTQGALKHGDSWRTRPDHIDYDAAERHGVKALDPEHTNIDLDTGELHLCHKIARLMLIAERELIRIEDRKSPNPTRIEADSVVSADNGE